MDQKRNLKNIKKGLKLIQYLEKYVSESVGFKTQQLDRGYDQGVTRQTCNPIRAHTLAISKADADITKNVYK